MPGLQHLGTLPRQRGFGEHLSNAVGIGMDQYARTKKARESAENEKERLTLAKGKLKVQQDSLQAGIEQTMINGMMDAMSSAIQMGDNDMALKVAQSLQEQYGKKYGFTVASLVGKVATSEERKVQTLKADKLARQRKKAGGDSAVLNVGAYDLLRTGKSLDEAEETLFGAFFPEGQAPSDEEEIRVRKEIRDRLDLAETDLASPEAFEGGRSFGKKVRRVSEAVTPYLVSPPIGALKQFAPELYDRIKEELPSMKGIGSFIRGATSGR